MDTVSYTAQWTAAIRATESGHGNNSLFQDPLANELAKPEGFKLLQKYRGGGVQEFVAIRTWYFDNAIKRAVQHVGFDQIVLVAAGMDTRAFRLNLKNAETVYEVDHQALLDEKRERLTKFKATPKVNRVEVAADLAGPWVHDLIGKGLDPKRKTLWVVEGLLFFLHQQEVETLLRTLAQTSAKGSRLITDMASKALLKSPMAFMFLAMLKADGIPWRFGTDAPREFLIATGWNAIDLKEPGETKAGELRWPYPTQDKSVKGVPRSWLIQADLISSTLTNQKFT